MMKTSYLAAIAAVVTVALGGCVDYPQKFQWSEAKVVESGWLKPRAQAVRPTYCYRTIGTPECYAWPLDNQGTRLVGYTGPSPN